MSKKKVLVTGMAGQIGGIVRRYLRDKYELSGLDLLPVNDAPSHVADLADLDAIRGAFEEQDTVVHLGADPSAKGSWESMLRHNIIGTYNVFEASRLAGVRRVVFASSNHVAGFHYLKDDPYKAIQEGRLADVRQPIAMLTASAMRPDGFYGVSKGFGELLGSYYHDQHGISAICLRIGGVVRSDNPGSSHIMRSLWLSHRDAAHLIERCIDAPPSVGFAVLYGTSRNTLRMFDIESAKAIIGFDPQDDAGVEG